MMYTLFENTTNDVFKGENMILETLVHGMIHPEETYHPMTEG